MLLPWETMFPGITGILLLIASGIGFRIYKESENLAIMWLSLGLIFVAIQSLMEAYINYLIDTVAGFYGSQRHFLLDAIRGVFIVLWAAMQALVLMEMTGITEKWVYFTFPLLITIAGVVYTFSVNLYSGIEDVQHRILISSIGRVLGILIPMALILGTYMIVGLAQPVGSRGALLIGIGFLLHGITLPFYSFAKEAGVFTLGLWYALGGVIPAALALYGFMVLVREQAGV